jgi:uncharacterized protein (TIGR03067 family)
MNMIRWLTLVCVTLMIYLPLFGANKDEKLIQGKWIGTEAGSPNEDVVELEFDGKEVHMSNKKTGEWFKGEFSINDSENPKQLIGTITDCPVREAIGKESNGIYELSDDSLTMAARAPGDPSFPKDFHDQESRVFSFKRAKPQRLPTIGMTSAGLRNCRTNHSVGAASAPFLNCQHCSF